MEEVSLNNDILIILSELINQNKNMSIIKIRCCLHNEIQDYFDFHLFLFMTVKHI